MTPGKCKTGGIQITTCQNCPVLCIFYLKQHRFHADRSTFPLCWPPTTLPQLYYTVDIFIQLYPGFDQIVWQYGTLQMSLFIFSISLSPSSLFVHSPYPWFLIPHMDRRIFPLHALPSLSFLILPPSGCSDAVSRPQIYAFGVSHCLAFPLAFSSHVPLFSKFSTNPLFLRQHLYSTNRWESYICSFSLPDIHNYRVQRTCALTLLYNTTIFNYTLEMKDLLIKL